jgi:transposase
MQGKKTYQEKLFTTFRLSDRIPSDNFYRRLNQSIDFNFLYPATRKYYGGEGNPGIDPVVFFKLLLTGYFENLRSDRQIIENARLRLDILFFIGFSIDDKLPWHSTISRTRQLYGQEVFKSLFMEVLKCCINKGMVGGRRQAIDSVFVKANASMDSLKDKEILDDGIKYIDSLNEDENVRQIPLSHQNKPEKRSNKNRYSPTDPDARMSFKPGKPTRMNYLGQVSVDTEHHVITNIEAHHADKKDSDCLAEALTHTIENLNEQHIEIKEILADTNYSSITALNAAHEKGIIAYIPNLGQYKPERKGFTYNESEDYYQCEQGVKLPFKRIKTSHKEGQLMRQYISSVKDCKNCPLKTSCIGKSNFKTIAHSSEKPLLDQMHHLMQTTYAKQMRKLRQSTVEPVIGTLVNFLSMNRVNSKGIGQANKHIIGAAIAYNLKKWMKWKERKLKIVAIGLLKKEENTIFDEFLHIFSTITRRVALQIEK